MLKEAILLVLKLLTQDEELKQILKKFLLELILEIHGQLDQKDSEAKLLTTVEVCKLLSISRVTLSNWVKKELLNKFKVAGSSKTFYSLQQINQILKDPSFKNGHNYYGQNLEPP